MDMLLKNCSVLVKENGVYVDKDYCVGITGGKISYLGSEIPTEKADWVKDMQGRLIMPGFVNAHGHTPMVLTRSVGCGHNLQDWLNDFIFPVEAKMTPEDIRVGSTWGIMEMLAGGTTAVADMYDFPWANAESFMASGIKAKVCRVGLAFSETEEVPPNRFNECVDLVKNFKDPKGRVEAHFCLHSEYLTNEKFARQIAEANREYKVPVHIHVSETKFEHEECIKRHGKTPVEYLEYCGILDAKTYLAHCVWVSDNDLAIMKKHGASMVHNPSSNMKLGSGFAPVKKAVEMGVNVALGTDGCGSNDNLNMFEELHLASLIHNGYLNDPVAMLADNLIDMATVNGAKACGFENTGEIAVGKQADLIAVDMNGIHLKPNFVTKNLVCYSMQGSDVRMTMVDGQILYENGEFLTIDAEKAEFEFKKAIERLY